MADDMRDIVSIFLYIFSKWARGCVRIWSTSLEWHERSCVEVLRSYRRWIDSCSALSAGFIYLLAERNQPDLSVVWINHTLREAIHDWEKLSKVIQGDLSSILQKCCVSEPPLYYIIIASWTFPVCFLSTAEWALEREAAEWSSLLSSSLELFFIQIIFHNNVCWSIYRCKRAPVSVSGGWWNIRTYIL